MRLTVDTPLVGPLTFETHGDHIARVMQRSGKIYEADLLQHIAATGPRQGIWIDCGANVGTHSIYFGKLKVEVMAFEPIPENAGLLSENIALNDVEQYVTDIQLALGNVEQACTAVLAPTNMGMCRVVPSDTAEQPILMTTLDAFLAPADQITMMKIDVEGTEMAVLEGARRTLNDWHPCLYIEINPENLTAVDAMLREYEYVRQPKSFAMTPVWNYLSCLMPVLW